MIRFCDDCPNHICTILGRCERRAGHWGDGKTPCHVEDGAAKCPVCGGYGCSWTYGVCSASGTLTEGGDVEQGSGRKPEWPGPQRGDALMREPSTNPISRKDRSMMSAIQGNDIGDFCDLIWANAAPQHRAGPASPGALRSPPFGDHRISQGEKK